MLIQGTIKYFSTWDCVFTILETMKTSVYKFTFLCASLTGLSNPFDFLEHYLLIIKLKAYDFNLPALRSIND